jgi:hypothetical protein
MGLLDDAIREHLELKRRRGADPTEVARQQQEALAPVGGAGEAAWHGEERETPEPEAQAPPQQAPPQHAAADEHPTEAHEQLAASGEEPAVQETAEIDMQTMLDQEAAGPVDAGAEHADGPAEMSDGDETAWEPTEYSEEFDDEVPREIPGQERMSFE